MLSFPQPTAEFAIEYAEQEGIVEQSPILVTDDQAIVNLKLVHVLLGVNLFIHQVQKNLSARYCVDVFQSQQKKIIIKVKEI